MQIINKAEQRELQLIDKQLTDDRLKMQDHKNIIIMLKTDAYIDSKIAKMNVKMYPSIFHKIKMIRILESNYGLEYLDVAYTKNDNIVMTDEQYNTIKKLFRTTKTKPTNLSEFKTLYISMLKNVLGNDSIIGTKTY